MISVVELELEFALIMKNEYCPRIKFMFIRRNVLHESFRIITFWTSILLNNL